jgi:hypothetical protein
MEQVPTVACSSSRGTVANTIASCLHDKNTWYHFTQIVYPGIRQHLSSTSTFDFTPPLAKNWCCIPLRVIGKQLLRKICSSVVNPWPGRDAPDRVVYGVRGRPVQQKFGRTGSICWYTSTVSVPHGLGRRSAPTSRRYLNKVEAGHAVREATRVQRCHNRSSIQR